MATIVSFGNHCFTCPKCNNDVENTVTYIAPDKDRTNSPKTEYLEVKCSRCEFEWLSTCRGVDIEQEWSDLDLFTDECPKCEDKQLKMKYCEGSTSCKLDQEAIKGEEHLHCECDVCHFEWDSVVADKKLADNVVENKGVEAKAP